MFHVGVTRPHLYALDDPLGSCATFSYGLSDRNYVRPRRIARCLIARVAFIHAAGFIIMDRLNQKKSPASIGLLSRRAISEH